MKVRELLVGRWLQQVSLRDLFAVGLPLLALTGLAFYVAFQYIQPAPPRQVTMGGGSESGAYRVFATRYHDVLARYGVDLRVEPTQGATDNLARLRLDAAAEPAVAVAFAQAGMARGSDNADLLSLGEVFYEPVWIFYRPGADDEVLDRLAQLRGRRLVIGAAGSGTQALALELLAANGIDQGNSRLLSRGDLEVVADMQRGRVDAVFAVGPPESPLVWSLLFAPGVRLMSLAHAEAYARRLPHLTVLTLPRGAADLPRELPPRDMRLLATRAVLLARRDTHPALIDLLLLAANETHGAGALLQRPGEFPRIPADASEYQLAAAAARYFSSGPPWLQKHLPFWAANLVDRMLVLLLPLLGVLLPVLRFAPSLYGWRIKSRIYARYGELKFLELELAEQADAQQRAAWLARLDRIEDEVNRMQAPLMFADMIYTLRTHIRFVRARIAA